MPILKTELLLRLWLLLSISKASVRLIQHFLRWKVFWWNHIILKNLWKEDHLRHVNILMVCVSLTIYVIANLLFLTNTLFRNLNTDNEILRLSFSRCAGYNLNYGVKISEWNSLLVKVFELRERTKNQKFFSDYGRGIEKHLISSNPNEVVDRIFQFINKKL